MNAVVNIQPSNELQMFDLQQRQARMFASSPLVPDHLRKGTPEQALANCYIALKLAEIMGEAPLIVMQNIHVVQGKAGFDAKYMIARANRSEVFADRIDWDVDRSDPNNLSVTAYALLAGSEKRVEFTCDMKMAKAEQWTRNPKYTSMPELMLRYRSATLLIRLYAPDVMLGYHTTEEYQDMAGTDAVDVAVAPRLTRAALADHANDVDEGRADEDHGDQFDGTESTQTPSQSAPPVEGAETASGREAGADSDIGAAPANFTPPSLVEQLRDRLDMADDLAAIQSVSDEFDAREAEIPYADQPGLVDAINAAKERILKGSE